MLWEQQTRSGRNRSGRWIETRLHQLSHQNIYVVYVQLIRSVIPTDLLVTNRIQEAKGVGEGVVISCPVRPDFLSVKINREFILVRRLALIWYGILNPVYCYPTGFLVLVSFVLPCWYRWHPPNPGNSPGSLSMLTDVVECSKYSDSVCAASLHG